MPAPRRRPWNDEVTMVNIGDFSRCAGPAWRDAKTVALTVGETVTNVDVVEVEDASTFSGTKRYLRCPRCGSARAMVLGFLEGVGWSCRLCGRWKSRDRNRLLRRRHSSPPNQPHPEKEMSP